MIFRRFARMSAIAVLLAAGCGPKADDMSKERMLQMAGGSFKEVVAVSGKVTVDGEPKGGVTISVHETAEGKLIREMQTSNDGTYCWTTYDLCDGLEPGNYRITFQLYPRAKRNDRVDKKEDAFKGKYANALKSEFKLKVEKGSPQTNVDYDLKTK